MGNVSARTAGFIHTRLHGPVSCRAYGIGPAAVRLGNVTIVMSDRTSVISVATAAMFFEEVAPKLGRTYQKRFGGGVSNNVLVNKQHDDRQHHGELTRTHLMVSLPARRNCPLQSSVQEGSHRSMALNPSPWLVRPALRAPDQMARAGTVAARAPQVPERIEESRERSAESMLSRQRYFTCTHWMA